MDEESGNQTQFSLTISTDRDGFLRRTCPACGLDFKTEIDQSDLSWALCSQIERFGLDVGAKPAEEDSPPEELSCPYCLYRTAVTESHTDETSEYLKHFAYREYVLPMIEKEFRGLADSFGESRQNSFISISFEHHRSPKPVRPFHGPEPADMKIVEFLCCGKKIKILEGWNFIERCVYCQQPTVLI